MPTVPCPESLKQSYDRDGFVVLRGYLDADEIADLTQRAERCAAAIRSRRGAAEVAADRFRDTLKNLEAEDSWFADQLRAGAHVPLLRALVGDELEPAAAAWFDRPDGSEQRIAPHIDGIGRRRGPHVGATLWIALDPTDRDNGCLHYGRGSHRVAHGATFPVPDFDIECADAVPIVANPGDAVVHSALTVHWSGENHSGRPRRAVSFFYWGASSQPVKGAAGKAAGKY